MPKLIPSTIKTTDVGYIRRTFWRYSLPAITAMLVNGLYQIVDGIFIGRVIGYTGLAAINMAWPIIIGLAGLGIMVGIGAGSLLSIHQGKADVKEVESQDDHYTIKLLLTSVYLMLVLGLIASVTLHYFSGPLLILQGGTHEGINLAQRYISWFSLGGVISILAAAFPLLIRNDNSPLLATGLMGFGALLNIFLDYLFISRFDLGLEGAALATLSAQLIVSLLGIIYFFSDYSTKPFKTKIAGEKSLNLAFKFNFGMAKKITTLGSSSLIIYLYTSIMVALHNALFMQYGDALTVGAYAIVSYLMVLYYFVAEGIADGSQPPVSYFYGAKRTFDIKALISLSIKVTLIAGFSWTLLLNAFPTELVELFSHQDDALIQTTIQGIQLHLFALGLDGFIMLATIYFTSVNQAGKALFIALGNMVIQLPFLYFFPKWFGVEGVWLAMPVSNVVLFIIVAPLLYFDINTKCHSSQKIEGLFKVKHQS